MSITVAGEGLVLQGRCVQGLQRLRTGAVEVGRQDGEGCSVPFREASALAVDHEVTTYYRGEDRLLCERFSQFHSRRLY